MNERCPNCGYCPHCGRSNAVPPYLPVTYPYPYRPWVGPLWAGSGRGFTVAQPLTTTVESTT